VDSKDLERAKRIMERGTVGHRKLLETVLKLTTKTGKVKWFKFVGYVVIYRNKKTFAYYPRGHNNGKGKGEGALSFGNHRQAYKTFEQTCGY
jgi:hypothetical protein